MKKLIQMPPEVAQVFGSAASKFVDYLADIMSNQADEVQTMSALSFERTLIREISVVQSEIADVRNEVSELRADVRSEIADMRTEMAGLRADLKDEIHTQIAGVNGQIVGLHQNIAGLHEKISDVHKQISSQTKWLLVMMLAAVTLYPIINQLVQRYL